MRLVLTLIGLSLVCCRTAPEGESEHDFRTAQALVDRLVAEHPEIVRLTIHAVPAGETASRIIACNLSEKLGRLSDPEDLEAMSSGKATALREGGNLDLTAPILDGEGRAIAATGITLAPIAGATDEELLTRARAIARELTEAVAAAEEPLW